MTLWQFSQMQQPVKIELNFCKLEMGWDGLGRIAERDWGERASDYLNAFSLWNEKPAFNKK